MMSATIAVPGRCGRWPGSSAACPTDRSIAPFLEFQDEWESWTGASDDDLYTLYGGEWGEGAQPLSRYFFHNLSGDHTEHTHRQLLDLVHTDMLESFRASIGSPDDPGFSQPPRSLVEYFQDCGVPLFTA
jgi:hypothetical protein